MGSYLKFSLKWYMVPYLPNYYLKKKNLPYENNILIIEKERIWILRLYLVWRSLISQHSSLKSPHSNSLSNSYNNSKFPITLLFVVFGWIFSVSIPNQKLNFMSSYGTNEERLQPLTMFSNDRKIKNYNQNISSEQ